MVRGNRCFSYKLVIEDDPAFDDPGTGGYNSGILGSAVRSRTAPVLPYGRYLWKVIAYADTAGTSELTQSPLRTLTITSPLLKAPILAGPASGAISFASRPGLSWNPVTDSAYYEIWIDNGTAFTSREYEGRTASNGTTHTLISDLMPGRYYWKIRAVNQYGVPGAWSGYRSLTVSAAVPNLSAPTDGQMVSGIPRYTWLAVTGASIYQFEYAVDVSFSSGKFTSEDLTELNYSPLLQDPSTYHWRVRARDVLGNWSGWSGVRQVIIAP